MKTLIKDLIAQQQKKKLNNNNDDNYLPYRLWYQINQWDLGSQQVPTTNKCFIDRVEYLIDKQTVVLRYKHKSDLLMNWPTDLLSEWLQTDRLSD